MAGSSSIVAGSRGGSFLTTAHNTENLNPKFGTSQSQYVDLVMMLLMLYSFLGLGILSTIGCIGPVLSFSPTQIAQLRHHRHHHHQTSTTSVTMNSQVVASDNEDDVMKNSHPFCSLPGDPSLILTTNVDLGGKKLDIMKAISKAIVASTGKPESYVAVSITDKADVIFGGNDAPTALGVMYSIGAIGAESNGAITKAITDLLETEFNVPENRIYINFFDMPRANVGWSRRTFAG